MTLPEGPLGSWKVPSSSPDVMARLRWEVLDAFMSRWYFSSTN